MIPPTFCAQIFYSSALAIEGSRNYVGVNEPVVDYLVEAAEAASHYLSWLLQLRWIGL